MNDENGTVSGLVSGTQGAIKAAAEIGEIFEDEIKQRSGQVMIDGRMKQGVRKKAVNAEIPDLHETVDMMCSHDFEDRMRAEYWQLRIRRMKLKRQLEKLANNVEMLDEIDEAQKGLTIQLMKQQLRSMEDYAELLIERAVVCGIDLCAGDAESIAERCVMADKHRQETNDLKRSVEEGW